MTGFQHIFPRLFRYANLEHEEQQRRSILLLLVILTCVAGLLYSLIYAWLGVIQAVYAILVYIIFSTINIALYYVTGNYRRFRTFQLVGILIFPTLAHFFVGGFERSSAVILAAMMGPLGAMMFYSARAARFFFICFLLLISAAAAYDLFYPSDAGSIPLGIRMLFYVFNIGAITSITFFLLQRFVSDNETFKRELKEKNTELALQTQKLEDALYELKVSQDQLIQHEKLAYLGQLAAGIAHEIQNPLNFVNNFSEVSNELLDELEEEVRRGDTDEAFAVAAVLRQNLGKIYHHGKRADLIVKGMLQHSSSRSGQKELTDINALCEEYLRIAYHSWQADGQGFRSAGTTFTAAFNTRFDASAEHLWAHKQDIGRVLLNILNNAFYAVYQKSLRAGNEYHPEITITTSRDVSASGRKMVVIAISDNGDGIPEDARGKVFQPFFTTKPTGQGTGLGLSLSYDIITKGHGGTLQFVSESGAGTTFTITLPC